MLTDTYKESVNIPDDDGWLPIHHAAWSSSLEAMKYIAELNTANLQARLPGFGTVAHLVIRVCCIDKLRYIHSIMPELMHSVADTNRTLLHELVNINDPEMKVTASPVSVGSDILRYLLRHCPSLVTVTNSSGKTLYDLLPTESIYARRLLLLAGASSLYPGMLRELNYAERRVAMFVFFSSAAKQMTGIFPRIRDAPGAAELIRTIIGFL